MVWDNLPAHKMAVIETLISSRGAQVIFLPPYSPDLNPIELLWSKLKEIIRGYAPKTVRAFNRALSAALSKITKSDLKGWFAHCGYAAQRR